MFETRLSEMFGADYPIMNAGMGGVAFGDLAGAVTSSGGIGVIAATGLTPERLGEEIDRAREWGEGPLVIDSVFPIRAPDDSEGAPTPEYIPTPIQQLEEELEEMGADVPDYDEIDANTFDKEQAREHIEVAIEKDVDALAMAVGTPEWAVKRAHEGGLEVIALSGMVRHAVYADEAGADIIIADGTEGGGHSGPVPTFQLIPRIQAAVPDKPVVAAGGLTNGAQVLAAIAAGAEGAWLGTRFIPTEEAAASDAHKRNVLEAEDADATVRSELADGFYLRMIRNRFTEVWEGHEDEIRDFPEQAVLTTPVQRAAEEVGAEEYRNYPAGQGSMLIEGTDEYPSATEVMDQLIADAEAAYDRLVSIHRE